METEKFSYSFKKIYDLRYEIEFTYQVKSTRFPIMTLEIKVPLALEYHVSHYLAIRSKNITLNSYFEGEDSELRLMEGASGAVLRFGNIASTLINVAAITRPGSGFSFRGKLTNDIIQYLR